MFIQPTHILFFLLAFGLSFSQGQNFSSGYLVKLNGDTLYGEIALDFGEDESQQALFRQNEGEDIGTFEVEDLVAFAVDDIPYRSLAFSYTALDEEMISLHGIMEVLFDGEITLLMYKTPSLRKVFFLQSSNKELHELIRLESRTKTINEKFYEVEDLRYRKTLRSLLISCPSIHEKVDVCLYNKKQLIKLIRAWHECVNAPYVSLREDNKSGLRMQSIPIGLSMNPARSSTTIGDIVNVLPALSAEVEFQPSGYSLWSFQVGVELFAFQLEVDDILYSFPLILKRRLPLKKGDLYAKFGMSPVFTLINPNFSTLSFRENIIASNMFQVGLGYELPFPKRTPLFVEGRVFHNGRTIPIFGIKAGIRL